MATLISFWTYPSLSTEEDDKNTCIQITSAITSVETYKTIAMVFISVLKNQSKYCRESGKFSKLLGQIRRYILIILNKTSTITSSIKQINASLISRSMFWIFAVLISGCASAPPTESIPSESSSDLTADVQGSDKLGVRGMSFEEVRNCASDARDIFATFKVFENRNREIHAAQSKLKQQEKAIESDRHNVDVTNKASVDQYNAQIEAIRKDVSELNTQITQFNQEVTSNQPKTQKFNLNCSNRPYRSTDVDRLPPDLKVAWKKIGSDKKFNLPVYYEDDQQNSTATVGNGGGIHLGGSKQKP